MKINDTNLAGVNSPGVGKSQSKEETNETRAKNAQANNSSAPDHVQLSGLGQSLRAADPNSPERAAYLEKLSAEVATGNYKVDSVEISKSIIKDALKDG